MENRTRYQEKVIKRYYDNRDAIAVQRLQELVTELFLSTGKKRQQCWKHLRTHLENLKVPVAQIDNLEKQDNPELVAKFIQKFSDKA